MGLRTTGWFLILALLFLGATFGPIVIGATGSFFWRENSEYSERHTRILRLVRNADFVTSYFPVKSSLGGPSATGSDVPCKATLLKSISASESGVISNAELAVFHAGELAEREMLRARLEEARAEQLQKLPSVAVGVLDACLHSTPLSPLCGAFLDRKMKNLPSGKLDSLRAVAASESKQLWCLLEDRGVPN